MTTAIKRRRGTTTQHATFTGLEGEITIDTTKDTAVVHDGATAGGRPLLREDLANNTEVVTKTGTQTLTNKTLTSPVINTPTGITKSDISLGNVDNTSDATKNAATATLTNKTITLGANTITGTVAQFQAAVTDGDFATLAGTETLTNKAFNGTLGATTPSTIAATTISASGVSTFSAGSAGAPALTTAGDTNTGIFFPAADTIAFSEGGTESMRIDSAGNLALGVSTAAAKFDIAYSDNSRFLLGFGANLDNYYTSGTSGTQIFRTGTTERMRLDSSGNLGLGVTPSAWGTTNSVRALQLNSGALWNFSTTAISLIQNAYYNGTNYIYSTTAAASRQDQASGIHYWLTAPSGTAGTTATFTERMRIDTSGNVQIGTSSDSIARLTIRGTHANNAVLWAGGTDANYTGFSVRPNSASNVTMLSSEWATATVALSFGLGGSEKMRIDTSGNLLVGTTSAGGVGGITVRPAIGGAGTYGRIDINQNQAADGMSFLLNGTQVGRILISTTTSYVTTSDYRLKENVAPMTGALAKIQALKPVTYNWKSDGSDGQGFIAHELAEVVPDCVVGEKDATEEEEYEINPAIPAVLDEEGNEVTPAVEAVMGTRTVPVYQGIDTSFLVATLTAAIQELKAELDITKAKVAALEAA